jgi:hypothetical protein
MQPILEVNNTMAPFFVSPLALAALAAAAFGFLGHKLRQNQFSWGFGGALTALVLGSFAVGLAHASTIPYTNAHQIRSTLLANLVTIAIISAIGAALWYWNKERQPKI